MTEPEPELEEGAVVPLSPLEPALDEPEELDFELLEPELPDELDPDFAVNPGNPTWEPEPEDVEPDEDAAVWAEAGKVAATPAAVRTLTRPAAAVILRSRARLRSRVLIAAPAQCHCAGSATRGSATGDGATSGGRRIVRHCSPSRLLMSLSLTGRLLESL